MIGVAVGLILLLAALLMSAVKLQGPPVVLADQPAGEGDTEGNGGQAKDARAISANDASGSSNSGGSSDTKASSDSDQPTNATQSESNATTADSTEATSANPQPSHNQPAAESAEEPQDGTDASPIASPTSDSATETEASTTELPEQLPEGKRVVPLYSEPSAEHAATLESSNPFLDSGGAKSVVYVIDKSSSMQGRLARVLTALTKAMDQLTTKQQFQLIFFDDTPHQYPQHAGLMDASDRNKGKSNGGSKVQ